MFAFKKDCHDCMWRMVEEGGERWPDQLARDYSGQERDGKCVYMSGAVIVGIKGRCHTSSSEKRKMSRQSEGFGLSCWLCG
jgi:hypothetical protein